jgi:hypothetical protein
MKLGLHLPINSVSFGQVSTLLLRTLHEREKNGNTEIDWFLYPIGGIDLSSQKEDQEFNQWLQSKLSKTFESYSRDIPVFKLWHLDGSLESVSRQQSLLSFYELDRPTKLELNIARNNKMYFSSKYTCDVFNIFGVDSQYLPLAFDSYNFKRIEKPFHLDNRIVFNVCGKFEKRKHHAKVIKAWIKKFGGDRRYVLQCAVYNPFFSEQQNSQIIQQLVGGQKPFNVSFFPLMKENLIYNDFLNSAHISIGMSGGEGWGLPDFQSVCLGKHAVLLNAHAYKSWATPESVVFVNPTEKIDAADGVFFKTGNPTNQGNIFDFNEDEFIAGCEAAIKRVQANPVNTAGLKLQEEYSKEKFADNIISILKGTYEYKG